MQTASGRQKRGQRVARRSLRTKVSAEDLALRDAPAFSVRQLQGAEAFLDRQPELSRLAEQMTGRPDEWVRLAAKSVRKITREQHIRAIAFAYSVWIKANLNPAYRAFVDAAKAKRKRIHGKTTELHLIVESIISYGDDSQETRNAKRTLYNRDVQLIRNLYEADIGPDEVEDVVSRPGEGLKKWSRKGKIEEGPEQNAEYEALKELPRTAEVGQERHTGEADPENSLPPNARSTQSMSSRPSLEIRLAANGECVSALIVPTTESALIAIINLIQAGLQADAAVALRALADAIASSEPPS